MVRDRPVRRETTCRCAAIWVAVLWCSVIAAQNAELAPQPVVVEKTAPAEDAAANAEDAAARLKTQQKRRVTVGLVVVTLVTASGAAMLAFTVLGGIATRRGLRKPFTEEERTPVPGPAAPSLDPDLNENSSEVDTFDAQSPEESE